MGIIEEWESSKSLFKATLPSIFDSLSSPPVWLHQLCETSGKAFNYYISSRVFRGICAQGQCHTHTQRQISIEGTLATYTSETYRAQNYVNTLFHFFYTYGEHFIFIQERRDEEEAEENADGEDSIISFVYFVISRWEPHNVRWWWWGWGWGLLNGSHRKENERKSRTVHNDTLKGLLS